MDARLCHQETNGESMKILKAIWHTIKFASDPHCDHEAGICLGGQGRECKFKINKNGVKIERKNLRLEK